MSTSRSSQSAFLGLAIVAIVFAGLAAADETTKAMPPPQKPIVQPFLDAAVGSWTTESTMTHEGKESKGTGKATFTKAIGGTAILQTYENTSPGPDGKVMTFHGHGVYKLDDDGKTVTLWWFCNLSPDVTKMTGTVSDSDLQLSGDGLHGERMTISVKKSADGLAFEMKEGEEVMKETYRRAR